MDNMNFDSDDTTVPDKGTSIAVREVLCRIGDKWSLSVVSHLRGQALRFNELKRKIDGISQRMLALTLRNMERDGLIARTAYAAMPLRVRYELTTLGRTLIVPVTAMLSWAEKHRISIEYSRRHFDERLCYQLSVLNQDMPMPSIEHNDLQNKT